MQNLLGHGLCGMPFPIAIARSLPSPRCTPKAVYRSCCCCCCCFGLPARSRRLGESAGERRPKPTMRGPHISSSSTSTSSSSSSSSLRCLHRPALVPPILGQAARLRRSGDAAPVLYSSTTSLGTTCTVRLARAFASTTIQPGGRLSFGRPEPPTALRGGLMRLVREVTLAACPRLRPLFERP